MNQYLPRVLLLGLLASASTALAQSDLSFLFTSRPKYWFSASVNLRSGSGGVKFGNLGTLPRNLFETDANSGLQSRVYDNGFVALDGPRPDQPAAGSSDLYVDANGQPRYRVRGTLVDGTSAVVGDYLQYQPGLTRYYQVQTGDQVKNPSAADPNGSVSFQYQQTYSQGAGADISGKSSAGFDLQLARDFGIIGKRGSWGIAMSFGINDINAKTRQTLTVGSLVLTDVYSLNKQSIPAPDPSGYQTYYIAPSYADFTVADAASDIVPGGKEVTVPLSQDPIGDSQSTTTKDGATVTGTWKLKGAYYLVRIGPSIRVFLNKRFSISANAGFATAYIGSEFSIDETLVTPVLNKQPSFSGFVRKKEVMFGAYGEANLEYWLTFRTGLFAGVVYESLGTYKQKLLDATADVDIGSGLNFRLGVITRF